MDAGVLHLHHRLDFGTPVLDGVHICNSHFPHNAFGVQFRLGKGKTELLYNFDPCGEHIRDVLSCSAAVEPLADTAAHSSGGAYSVPCI